MSFFPIRARRRLPAGVLGAVLAVSLLGAGAKAEDPVDFVLGDPGRTYPNLVPDVTTVVVDTYRFVQLDTTVVFEEGLFLLFDTRAQNLGRVPVQLTVDKVDTPESSSVSQCVSWRMTDAHLCRATQAAGGYEWHEAHHHFHYEDFATYELRRLGQDGRTDYSDPGLLRAAGKVSFCFLDSRRVREDARPTQFYATCLPTVQGISPGWTDVYDYDTPGQSFSVAGLPDGRYVVTVDLDYENTLQETNDDDNYVEVTVELTGMSSGSPTAVIVDRRWPTPNDRLPSSTTTTTVKKPKKDREQDRLNRG